MKIKYSKQAEKTLKKMDRISRERIMDAICDLPKGDTCVLGGKSGFSRLRVGDWRILFYIDEYETMCIGKIDTRRKVYNVLHEEGVEYVY